MSLLTTDKEDAARQGLSIVVSQGIVALVCLRYSLRHPDLPTMQQPPPASVRVRPIPQHNWYGLRWSAPRRKLQQTGIFRDAVLKVLPVVFVVGPNAF